jgi:hypothetical protein
MKPKHKLGFFCLLIYCSLLANALPTVMADPCGMVPPIYTGEGPPITRIGLQKTYVFHNNGIETFVIHPGFSGKVDQFGMLIPFPNVPAIRKVSDDLFEQVANAIDPPEVVVDLLREREEFGLNQFFDRGALQVTEELGEEVRVVKQEAVGMYEVAVLQAGSADALKKWMDTNGYQFPEGMEPVTEEYIADKWCFVAVKTKVGVAAGVDAKPGQRDVDSNMKPGSSFDGFVQAMGFRFKSDELVVPMRLSTFNGGDTRNVVYIMTDGPRKIRNIPEEFVVRQISGEQLLKNVTQLLPLRVIGGTEKDFPDFQKQTLPEQRNPVPQNGVARNLFAADLLASISGELALPEEELEKQLLQVGEFFGLRGAEIDQVNAQVLLEQSELTNQKSLKEIKNMVLTVVDGDFPRDVLASQNLKFANYAMPAKRNVSRAYDAKLFGPGGEKSGTLIETSSLDTDGSSKLAEESRSRVMIAGMITLCCCLLGLVWLKSSRGKLLCLLTVGLLTFSAAGLLAEEKPAQPIKLDGELAALVEQLNDGTTAQAAIEKIVALAATSDKERAHVLNGLYQVATTDEEMVRRGWAIAAMAKLGGLDVDEKLIAIHSAESQSMLVRTWAAAARVSMVKSPEALVEKASLIATFPSLGRPIGMRLLEQMQEKDSKITVAQMISLSNKTPELQQALIQPILAAGADELAKTMTQAEDMEVRRQAAAYLGTLGSQDYEAAAKAVIAIYAFDAKAKKAPWDGGPLYVPSIQWNKELGTELVNNLVTWNVWCEENEKSQEQQQIYNNLRSISLAQVVGYQVAGDTGAVAWLTTWEKIVGKERIEKMLTELGVADKAKYKQFVETL